MKKNRITRNTTRPVWAVPGTLLGAMFLGVLLLIAAVGLGASPGQEEGGEGGARSEVIATTAWTAAFVQLAGAERIRVLAPYEMRHPPEYELRPSDIEAVTHARLIVYAGYETMVDKLKEAAGRNDVVTLQIDTRNDLSTTRAAVEKIAAALGTERVAAGNLDELERYFDAWRRELAELGLAGAPVLVHAFQQPLARELGFEVRGVFGPGPLEPAQIATLSEQHVVLIIDNWHNEIAKPLTETVAGALRVSWLNFPGAFGTRGIRDVLEYNRRALSDAWGRRP